MTDDYKSHFHQYFTYYSTFWRKGIPTSLNKLTIIQRRVLRNNFIADHCTISTELHAKSTTLTIKEISKIQCLFFIYQPNSPSRASSYVIDNQDVSSGKKWFIHTPGLCAWTNNSHRRWALLFSELLTLVLEWNNQSCCLILIIDGTSLSFQFR